MNRLFNFSAGPAVLPEEVLAEASDNLLSLGDSGIGILEHSHRGDEFAAILAEAQRLCRELADLPEDIHVLFLQGGASLQFAMVPANLRAAGATADYLISGHWSQKALQTAATTGLVHVAGSSPSDGSSQLPGPPACSRNPAYLHYTSNNTILGTQFPEPPQRPVEVPLVCDASSDIFSRPLNLVTHDLVYAGAQKNLGPAGLTLVLVRESLLDRAPDTLPAIQQYLTHARSGSLYHTPPVFSIYVTGLVLKWLQRRGGLEAIGRHNQEQAGRLYARLDQDSRFRGLADPMARSLMNVTFTSGDSDSDQRFLATCRRAGLVGLAGHRSVGGLRASLYNALPDEAVDRLLEAIDDFETDSAE
ncbi:MAG: 3-phosphoserine/phosphohydroxythreonine transaminase [Planctomycetaceae bacterium]|nr:3-phosphoserine/phosphohydroxythreonine transaminase [Planctomycetaceae bacterium]MDP7277638.1 3-phosphoserine/phosphohydroxythreonine transaminase [Planctomycetaceae bacterium]